MFVLCAFSLCTLQLYRPYFVTAKCVLEEKTWCEQTCCKVALFSCINGKWNKEEGRKVEPITIINSNLEVCPHLFFTCIKCLMQGPTLVESLSLTFHWPQELDWMILVPSNSDYSVILWFHDCNRWRGEFQTGQNSRMCFMLCSVKTLWAKLQSGSSAKCISISTRIALGWAMVPVQHHSVAPVPFLLLGGCDGAVAVGVVRIRDFRSDTKCACAHLLLPPVLCPGDPGVPVSRGSGPRG